MLEGCREDINEMALRRDADRVMDMFMRGWE